MTLTKQSSSLEFGDPWRYQCPHCECHLESGILRRSGQDTKRTKHGVRDDPEAAFYCRDCQRGLRTLFDKKADEEVHVGTTT